MPAAQSLSELETMLGQVVIDAQAGQGLTVEAAPFLYHGPPIDDCCPEPGGKPRVMVWWSPIDASTKDNCGGPQAVSIHIRQLVCWQVPKNPVHADPQPFSATAAYLADAADVGTTALSSLICDRARARSLGIFKIEMLPTAPRKPTGACAGIDWALKVWPTRAGWTKTTP